MKEKIAFCYCRVSHHSQSATRQVDDLTKIVENHDWELGRTLVDEGFSSMTDKRPALQELMDAIHKREFDVLVITELSRLFRSTKHLLQMVELLNTKNIDLFVAKERICTQSAQGKLFFTIAAAFFEFEKSCINDRIKSGIANKRKKNPNMKWGRKGNLTPEVRDKIFEMRIEGKGLKTIAKECKVAVRTIRKLLDDPKYKKNEQGQLRKCA